MTSLDIAVLIIYVFAVTAFGALFYRRASTAEGFTAANHRLPGWVVGFSIFGTFLSSISFLALPGKAFAGDWNSFVFSLSLPLAAWAAVKWFVPLYRSTRDISAYAYLERRFGVWARLYAMTCYLLTQLARMGTILFLVALALERLTGWDIATIIIVTGVLVTLYTVIGGIEAVIWTDMVQAIILTIGALVAVVILVVKMPGGATQLFDIAVAHNKFSLGTFAPTVYESGFWLVLIYGLVINLQNFGIDQSYVQRFHTARSLEEARRSVWFGALLYVPVSALFFFIGSALFAYYSAQPALLPTDLQVAGMADRIFPHFIVSELPPGLVGLLIAALFAAAMSSVDSSLNSSATVLMSDVYRRFIRPESADVQLLRFVRVVTIVLGVLGTATALLMISIKSALDVWWNLAGIFSGGMIGLFLLGAISRRAASAQAALAVTVGVLVLLWAAMTRGMDAPWANPFHNLLSAVLGTLTIFLLGVLLSRKLPQRAKTSLPMTLHDL